jgi:hypothetical protein
MPVADGSRYERTEGLLKAVLCSQQRTADSPSSLGIHMSSRIPKIELLYVGGSPMRCARTAVAVVDQVLATHCARSWRCAQIVTIK